MSFNDVRVDALEARRLMFAQPVASDAGTVKRIVALTDAAIYFEKQPVALGDSTPSDDRAYVRLSRSTGQLETIKPGKGAWDLSNLYNARALGGDTVLLEFDDGSMWSVRDGSTKAEKLIGVEGIDYDGAAAIGHTLYFAGRGGNGDELYSTDGTARGTRALPQLRTTGDGDSNPSHLTAVGGQLLLTALTDAKPAGQVLRWDGKAFRPVEAIQGIVGGIVVANGRVVVASDGKLFTLSSDYKKASPFAASRTTSVDHLAAIGKDVAFLSAGGVWRSDLTTKGTIRLGDAPVTASSEYVTDLRIDPTGYLLHAYNGLFLTYSGNGLPTESPSEPAAFRLDAKSMTKVLDGSYSTVARVGDATYFVAGDGSIAGGKIVRIDKDGRATTLDVGANGARAAADARTLVFAAGTTLYAVDPTSTLGAVHGSLFSDDNLNHKYNGSDDAIDGTSVFADYDGDGRRDDGEPAAGVVDGSFTLTGLRAGTYSLRADVGGNYRGSVAAARVTVAARDVVEAKLLATPLRSTIRVEIFNDADGDGVRDNDESAAAGYTAFLDLDGDKKLDAGEPTVVTGADGVATFGGLRPQLYRVRVKSLHADDLFTTPYFANVHTSGDGVSALAVGVKHDPMTASIRGTLDDLIRTPNFSGVAVELLRGDVVVATTTATSKGVFRFAGLAAGDYGVRIKRVGRYASAGGGDAATAVRLAAGAEARPKVAVYVMPLVRGVAFVDINGDGTRDADEPTRAGVELTITENDTYEYFSGTTGADGFFEIPVSATGGSSFFGSIEPTDDATFATYLPVNVSDSDNYVTVDVPFAPR